MIRPWKSIVDGRRWLFRNRYRSSLVVAIGIETSILLVHDTSMIRSIEELAIDWVVEMRRGTEVPNPYRLRTVWIDIDDESFEQWGRPAFVPRDRLASLIRFSLAGSPALVIVDVDLSRPSEGDQPLLDVLRQAEAGEGTRVPLVLARRLRRAPSEGGSSPAAQQASFIETAIQRARNLFWASFAFDRDPDWSVRRWRMWESVCAGDEAKLIPSITLLASSLWTEGRHGARKLKNLLEVESEWADPNPCFAERTQSRAPRAEQDVRPVKIGHLKLWLPPGLVQQRIGYAIPWHLRRGEKRPTVNSCGREFPVLERLPADSIDRVIRDGHSMDSTILCDALVIIGGSFAEGHDLHRTPFGDMPGALVIVNSIYSLLNHGQIVPPSLPARVGVLVVLVLLQAWMSARLSPALSLVGSGLLILGMIPVSFWLFDAGIWLDFALPMVAVILHNLVGHFEGRTGHEA